MKFLLSSCSTCIFRLAMALAVLSVLLVAPTAMVAHQGDANSLIYPPDSQPFGMTYGDWSVAWWQYVFAIPASTNPLIDMTGANCSVGQSSGPVFFLNTNPFGGTHVTRTCSVPAASKAIWLPVMLVECSTVEAPPFNGNNPQELRTCAGQFVDGYRVNTFRLTVDGVRIHNMQRFRTQSPYYDFIMPATDNILGLPGVTSGSSVSDGYFVMLKPLSPGSHVIHFKGYFGPAADQWIELTYNLTVQ